MNHTLKFCTVWPIEGVYHSQASFGGETMKKKLVKSDFCLMLCCALSVTVISAVVFWLDNDSPTFSSDVALQEAESSISRYCLQSGMTTCDLKLVDASAPKASAQQDTRWNFEFYSPTAGPVTVEVNDRGEEHLDTEVKPGK